MNRPDASKWVPFDAKGECEGNREKCSLEDCPKFGTLPRRPSRDGKRRVRTCGDPVARGKRNKKSGARKQSAAATKIGIPRSSLRPGHEEFLPGALRIEVKSGAQVGPIWTRFLNAEAQSEAQRSVGDHRPFAFIAAPAGTKRQLLVCDLDRIVEVCTAILENWEVERQ